MEKKRANIFAKGSKKRTPAKKKKKKKRKRKRKKKTKRNEKRKLRRRKQEACRALAWEGHCNRDPCPFSHDEKKIEELKTTISGISCMVLADMETGVSWCTRRRIRSWSERRRK